MPNISSPSCKATVWQNETHPLTFGMPIGGQAARYQPALINTFKQYSPSK